MKPVIGITPDIAETPAGPQARCYESYVRAVEAAGGTPLVLAPSLEAIPAYLNLCNAFVIVGGDDPLMERYGHPTHPKATPVHPLRQQLDLALLAALDESPETPVLGVCLGMQYMALAAGGTLDQHLPETTATAATHWEHEHDVTFTDAAGPLANRTGQVRSRHRQAITDPGSLTVAATAPDGIIEAVIDPARRFYFGVQWHPERTTTEDLGQDLFRKLIKCCN